MSRRKPWPLAQVRVTKMDREIWAHVHKKARELAGGKFVLMTNNSTAIHDYYLMLDRTYGRRREVT